MIGHILSHDYFTFKPIIMFQCSGFLSVNYNPGLTKYLFIYFSAINLKKMDSRILKLRQLVSLDLTGNLIKDISMFGDLNANKLDVLKELKLASNQVTMLLYIYVLSLIDAKFLWLNLITFVFWPYPLIFFRKMGHPRPLFCLFFIRCRPQIHWKFRSSKI